MVLGRSREGVDFPWLAELSQMCARPDAIATLMTAPDADAIFVTLSDAERDLALSPTAEIEKTVITTQRRLHSPALS